MLVQAIWAEDAGKMPFDNSGQARATKHGEDRVLVTIRCVCGSVETIQLAPFGSAD